MFLFETSVHGVEFLLLLVAELLLLFVVDDYLLALNSPPNFIENFGLLLGLLAKFGDYLIFPHFNLSFLLVMSLVDDHLSAALVALPAHEISDLFVVIWLGELRGVHVEFARMILTHSGVVFIFNYLDNVLVVYGFQLLRDGFSVSYFFNFFFEHIYFFMSFLFGKTLKFFVKVDFFLVHLILEIQIVGGGPSPDLHVLGVFFNSLFVPVLHEGLVSLELL